MPKERFDQTRISKAETDFEMVERHVSEGRDIVRRQEALMEELRYEGRGNAEAEQLLRTFKDTQELHEQHLQRLLADRV